MTRWEAFKTALRAAWKAWQTSRPIPVKFKTGVPDPALARADSGEGDPELQIPSDETQHCLYKDAYGNFATDTEIRLGIQKTIGPIVYAYEINDESAMDLLDRYDAIALDHELTPEEIALRDYMRKKLRERDV